MQRSSSEAWLCVFLDVALTLIPQHWHLQEVKWSQYQKGQPVGNSCLICLVTAITGFPGMSFDECAAKFHDPKEKDWKGEFQTARARRAKVEKGEPVPPIRPGSYVAHTQSMARTIFYDVLFCSDKEIENLTGQTAKSLKLKAVTLTIEDGSTLRGHFLSLKGLNPDEVGSLRRVRIEQKVTVAHKEALLEAPDQLRPKQGTELYNVAAKTHWLAVESLPKPNTRHTVPSVETLRAKAEASGALEGEDDTGLSF